MSKLPAVSELLPAVTLPAKVVPPSCSTDNLSVPPICIFNPSSEPLGLAFNIRSLFNEQLARNYVGNSRADSERVLLGKPAGTYCVRSSSKDGNIVISYIKSIDGEDKLIEAKLHIYKNANSELTFYSKDRAKITKDEHKNFNKVKAKIAVPPGYIILFNQNTIHEITATKLKYDSYRIFHGIRFTNNKNPIFNYNDIIKNQGVPPLPSGQQPPMYAKLHWTNHLNKLLDFSKTIHENCKEEKEMKSTGLKHNVVQRYVKSLKYYNFKLYPDYTDEEKQLFIPTEL